MKNILLLVGYIFIGAVLFLVSCKKQEPELVNEQETITTIQLVFTTEANKPFVVQWKDSDGAGGNPPVIDSIKLSINTTYNVSLKVLNESAGLSQDKTEEIKTEGIDHQFFFKKSSGLLLNNTYNDADTNGNPIGLSHIFETTTASTGELTTILRHKLDKHIPEVKKGDVTKASGATDLEVIFPIKIK